MTKVLRTESALGQLAVIVAVILTLALSVCAFDRDGDGVEEGLDICTMPMVTVAPVIFLPTLAVVGRAVDQIPGSESDPSPHPPDPPPKPAFAF